MDTTEMALTYRVIHAPFLSRHKRISLKALLLLQFPSGAGPDSAPRRLPAPPGVPRAWHNAVPSATRPGEAAPQPTRTSTGVRFKSFPILHSED